MQDETNPIGRKQILIIVSVILAAIIVMALGRLYVDYLWFLNLGFESVFLKVIVSKVALALAFGLVFFAAVYANVLVADLEDKKSKEKQAKVMHPIRWPLLAAASAVVALTYRNSWFQLLQYLNQAEFGIIDAVFSRDISFYVFGLPVYLLIWKFLAFTTIIALVATALVYVFNKGIVFQPKKHEVYIGDIAVPGANRLEMKCSRKTKFHLSGIAAFFFVLLAFKYYLNRFGILFSKSGIVQGAGYTDVHVALPVLTSLIIFSCVMAAILFIWPAYLRKKGFILGALAAFLVLLLVGQGIVPMVVQHFVVLPNEIRAEKPYLERNINMTRIAYGLDMIDEQPFPISDTAAAEEIYSNAVTLDNIRLWDPRPLKDTYKQLQEIRLYYDFLDVDIDRYFIDGAYTQVLVSPRELEQDQLPDKAKTWVNEHLAFTHGYGVSMSPVNRFTTDGLPEFYIKDIPPKTGISTLKIDRPQIYYGETGNDFVIVDTDYEEFDYPEGDKNQYIAYDGDGGVRIGSFFRRLLMALRFHDINIMLTRYVNADSRIMFHRNIMDRVQTIAPFIHYDPDPYMVVSEGRLFWMLDGYTVSDRFPYSEKIDGINYIRNPLKVVIDAYNGNVTYYIIDHDDPLINTYERIFPTLFYDFKEMPAGLKSHIRYPEHLFQIQSRIYGDYHMTDPIVFYNGEDKWDIPNEVYGEAQQVVVEPYHIIMKLPGKDLPEFIIMTPFTPHNKDNMIGWMAGRSDTEYGKLIVYKFQKQKLIYGPMQVEARIDQDADISEQLTLWDQKGSHVIRGNLLVIPIDHSLIYIEPLYLLAEKTQLPELKRVIVYYGTDIVMEKDLKTALDKLFGPKAKGSVPTIEAEEVSSMADEDSIGISSDMSDMIAQANEYFKDVQDAMEGGDWSGIGKSLENLQDVLEQMSAAAAEDSDD